MARLRSSSEAAEWKDKKATEGKGRKKFLSYERQDIYFQKQNTKNRRCKEGLADEH